MGAPHATPRFLTLREAAAVLRVAPQTLRNSFARRGGPWRDLPRARVGGKLLVPADAFEAWLGRKMNGG